MTAGAGAAGNSFDDANPGPLELADLIGIIRKQADGPDAERLQCRCGEIVVARIGGESKAPVGFDSVEALILKFVGFELVEQADAPALLRQVEQNAGRVLGNLAERQFELSAAVAALGHQDIAGETLRVDTDERRFSRLQLAMLDGYGFLSAAVAPNARDGEPAKARGQSRFRHNACLFRLFPRLHAIR